MDYFRYIVRFLYRIRWYLVTLPILAVILAWFLTRNMERQYDVETTIYTGIISGYNLETGTSYAGNSQVNLSNLMLIISTEKTIKKVSLRLFARCMMYGDEERDNNYMQAEHFKALNASVPTEVKALIDKRSESRTVDNLQAYTRPTNDNYMFNILCGHPYFGINDIASKLKVVHMGNSDMIQIGYNANDPGIAYNTIEILNDEFINQYQQIRFGETNNVIKFFEGEVRRLYRILCGAEDDLISYNVSKRVINYTEQTKMVANMDASHKTMENSQLLTYMSTKALVDYLENQLGDKVKVFKNNNEFTNALENISKLKSKVSHLDLMKDESNAYSMRELAKAKSDLNAAEEQIKVITNRIAENNIGTNGVKTTELVDKWLNQSIDLQKNMAEMQAMDVMRSKLDKEFLYFSPIGATLNRKERHIGFIEGNYMEMLKALNGARLRQRNLQMTTATLRVLNPPMFPLNAAPTNRLLILLATFLLAFMLVSLYFFLIELLDHTLRDRRRTQHLTKCKVLGCYPKESALRYRKYNKIINDMAIRHLSKSLLPFLDKEKKNVINLLSTGEGNGKSYIANELEELWVSMGLQVRRLTYDEDFLTDDKKFIMARRIEDLCPDLQPNEVVLIEYPSLSDSEIPPALLNEGTVNLMVTRANRTWKDTDHKALHALMENLENKNSLHFYLTEAGREAVEEYIGQLPPYTPFKNFVYRISQLGLTATENQHNK